MCSRTKQICSEIMFRNKRILFRVCFSTMPQDIQILFKIKIYLLQNNIFCFRIKIIILNFLRSKLVSIHTNCFTSEQVMFYVRSDEKSNAKTREQWIGKHRKQSRENFSPSVLCGGLWARGRCARGRGFSRKRVSSPPVIYREFWKIGRPMAMLTIRHTFLAS